MFYYVVRGIANFVLRIFFKIEVTGRENVPVKGRFVLCANHASNWDPVFISIALSRKISWMAKKELFKSKVLAYLLKKLGAFPVDRDGSDLSAIKNALRVLKGNNILGIFPEGTRVSGFDIDNAKPGVALLAAKSKSLIIPVNIDSNYQLFNKVKITIGNPSDFLLTDGQAKDYKEISINILRTIYDLKRV